MVRAGPFGRFSRRTRRRALWTAGGVVVMQLGPLLTLERQMKHTGGPGIIPFELAGGGDKTERILELWGAQGRAAAQRSLILDYPFPASYAVLHALACTAAADLAAQQGRLALARAGAPLAWAQLAAGLFDYVENTALLLILSGRDVRLGSVARRAALIKFGLLATGSSYLLIIAARSRHGAGSP